MESFTDNPESFWCRDQQSASSSSLYLSLSLQLSLSLPALSRLRWVGTRGQLWSNDYLPLLEANNSSSLWQTIGSSCICVCVSKCSGIFDRYEFRLSWKNLVYYNLQKNKMTTHFFPCLLRSSLGYYFTMSSKTTHKDTWCRQLWCYSAMKEIQWYSLVGHLGP